MKILYVIPIYITKTEILTFSTLGGGERYPFELAKFIKSNNPQDEILLLMFGNSDFTVKIQGLKINVVKGLRIFSFLNNNISPIPFSLKYLKMLQWADIIHGFHIHSDTITLTSLISKLFSKTMVLTDFGGGGRLSISRLISKVIKVEFLAKAVLCISNFDASFWKVKNKKVIYGGVDITTYVYQKKKKNYVLYVGRILPHKGLDFLIRSMPDNIKLIIAGRVKSLDYLNYLKNLSTNKDVEFIENPEDSILHKLYRDAACFILPSTHLDEKGKYHRKTELFGLVVVEAMASGTPVIVSSAGSLPELVKNGYNGYIYNDGDSKDLNNKIEKIVRNQKLIFDLGANGRRLAETKYNWSIIANNVRKMYNQLD